jgi:hypothetical protein
MAEGEALPVLRPAVSCHTLARPRVLRTLARWSPRVLGRDVCPQKYEQDSHDYIAPGPHDVRKPFAALPLVVRLPDDVAHDGAPYVASGSTLPPKAAYVFGTDLNCSESVGCLASERFHPLEIADVSKANLSGGYGPKNAQTRLPGDCDFARVLERVISGWQQCAERLRPADQIRSVWCRIRCSPPRAPFRARRRGHARRARR